MNPREEVDGIRRRIEDLRVKRARLAERIAQRERERDQLVERAKALGVEDTTRLAEWVEERRREFDAERSRILAQLTEAENAGSYRADS